jgi:hypothetical protein
LEQNLKELLLKFKLSPQNVKFAELVKVCEIIFGKARQSGTSHRVYKTPWQGDPRVNIQNSKGKAKSYQVKQVLRAIEKMKEKGHA